MRRRSRALVLFIVTLVVVGACSISLVHAAHTGTGDCGLVKASGPAKAGTGSFGSRGIDLAAIPVGIGSTAPLPPCASLPERLGYVASIVLAQPRVPRAPPSA